MVSKGNVWIVKQYAVPPKYAGNTRHHELGKRLAERGWQVTIFAADFHFSERPHETGPRSGRRWSVEEVEGVRFVWIASNEFEKNDWRRAFHFLKFATRAAGSASAAIDAGDVSSGPDVVVGCSVPPTAALAGWYLARKHGAKFIFEIGDIWSEHIIDSGMKSGQHPLPRIIGWLERILVRNAQSVISPLPYMDRFVKSARASDPPETFWISNGAELPQQAQDDGRKQWRELTGSGFTVVYIGLHGRATALETVVEAANLLGPTYRFLLVGDGPEKPRLEKLAASFGVTNVRFHESVPRSSIDALLLEADAGVFPLKDEAVFRRYGVAAKKLFDYMAAGLPVIYAAESPNNIIEQHHCGVAVPAEDPEQLAEAVRRLADLEPAKRAAMGARGRQAVRESFTWDRLSERFEECLVSTIGP